MLFEQRSELSELLKMYNDQMISLETQNKGLIVEIRRLAKMAANEIKAEGSKEEAIKLNIYEKNVKSLK